MQIDTLGRTFGKCPACGKQVIVRSKRDAASYCSRICAYQSRFKKRYQGTSAGPLDRPKTDKTKFQ